jgi:hypothetical protein
MYMFLLRLTTQATKVILVLALPLSISGVNLLLCLSEDAFNNSAKQHRIIGRNSIMN